MRERGEGKRRGGGEWRGGKVAELVAMLCQICQRYSDWEKGDGSWGGGGGGGERQGMKWVLFVHEYTC